jgi:hypothetical protein
MGTDCKQGNRAAVETKRFDFLFLLWYNKTLEDAIVRSWRKNEDQPRWQAIRSPCCDIL